MARPVDNFGTFLNAVKQRPADGPESPQRSSPAGSGAQRILGIVLQNPQGIEMGALYSAASMELTAFAEAVELLKKLNAIRVEKAGSVETAYPGPNSRDVISLVS